MITRLRTIDHEIMSLLKDKISCYQFWANGLLEVNQVFSVGEKKKDVVESKMDPSFIIFLALLNEQGQLQAWNHIQWGLWNKWDGL